MSRSNGFCRHSIFVALLSVWSALPAAAQGVGAIGGTIADSSDAVLPGVAVTLSSAQGTVGANQQSVTDARGAYQFLRLVPGTYIVKAELGGFRPAEQRNIVVSADATARADLKLQIGSLEEGVTVTGEAPLLDTTSALKQTVFSHDTLSVQPNRFDMWSIAKGLPSVTLSKLDVGGSEAFGASAPTVHGSSNEGGIFIDGMDVSQMDGAGPSAIFFLDPSSFAEANYRVGGAGSAAVDRGGLVFNMITRTGTNQLHGEWIQSGSIRGLGNSFDNFSPALKTQLLATVPARALAANPNLSPGAVILTNYDYGGWVSGPMVKDKLWFSFSAHDKVLNQYVAGNYNPDGTQVLDDNTLWFTSGKLAWQATKAIQLVYTNNLQHRNLPHRAGGGTFNDSKARNVNDKYPDAHMGRFTAPWGSKMIVDVSFNRFRVTDRFMPQPGLKVGDTSKLESTSNSLTEAVPSYRQNAEFRDQLHTSGNYFTGAHDLLFGYQITKTGIKAKVFSLNGMQAVYSNGVPVSVRTQNVPIGDDFDQVPERYQTWYQAQSFYVQDKWTPTKKLVINAGLRVAYEYGWEPATCQTATPFVAQQCFPEIKGVPDYWSAVPRFSAVYDMAGDGMTALKFAANRYNILTALATLNRVNPLQTASDTRPWTVCAAAQTSGCDLNRDLLPQFNELGPSNGFPAGAANRYATNLRPPSANEYSAELQRQLPGAVVLSAGYTYRQQRDNFGVRNMAVPTESYIPLTVTEANSGKSVTVYNQAPGLRGRIDNLWSNERLENTDYHGADITLTKRMSNGWSMMGGASFGKTTGNTLSGIDLNSPNSQFREGIYGNDTPWSYKLSGVYELPFQISTSATAIYYAGFPELTTVLVNSQTVALTQTSQSVSVEPRGTNRTPSVFNLDLGIQRPMKYRAFTLAPRIDLYNLTNGSTILSRVTTLGPAYTRAVTIQRGRVIKFGGKISF